MFPSHTGAGFSVLSCLTPGRVKPTRGRAKEDPGGRSWDSRGISQPYPEWTRNSRSIREISVSGAEERVARTWMVGGLVLGQSPMPSRGGRLSWKAPVTCDPNYPCKIRMNRIFEERESDLINYHNIRMHRVSEPQNRIVCAIPTCTSYSEIRTRFVCAILICTEYSDQRSR